MKKSLILLIVFAAFAFVACGSDKKDTTNEDETKPENSNTENTEEQETTDEDTQNAETSDIAETDADFENLNDSEPENNDADNARVEIREECRGDRIGSGGEGCNGVSYPENTEFRSPVVFHTCPWHCIDDYSANCYYDFVVKEIKQDSDYVQIRGKCLNNNGNETEKEATFSYKKYEGDIPLPDSLVGTEMHGFEIMYDLTGEFNMLRNGEGEIIYINNGGLWWDSGVRAAAHEFTAEQKIISTCESVCLMYDYDVDCDETSCDKEPYYDYVYYPPIEFTFEGHEPVLVTIGEVVESENCEYYLYFSKTVAPEDPDHEFYSREEFEWAPGMTSTSEFHFFNVNALK